MIPSKSALRALLVLVPSLLLVLGGCGGTVARESAPDAAAARGPANEGTTAGDASPDVDSGFDGRPPGDLSRSASSSDSDGSSGGAVPDPSPFASCSGARDVFYVAVGGKGAGGYYLPFPSNPVVVTNLDATWTGTALPLGASAGTHDVGGGSVSIATPDNTPLATGTYAQPLTTATPKPYLQLVVGDVGLTADGSGPGSFTVVDADTTSDDAGTSLRSFLVTFDLQVPTNGGMAPITGCMRYTADPIPVPGPAQSLGTGAALLGPCAQGGYGFYADLEGGYPGPAGVTHVDATDATFTAGTIGSTVELDVQAGTSLWKLEESASPSGTAGLQPGTYTLAAGGQGPTLQIVPPTMGCVSFPTGTFGVVDLASSANDVSKLTTWFDLQCAGQGSLRGCAVYGE